MQEQKQENPMREIRIEKVTLNIGTKTVNDSETAYQLLEKLVSRKPVLTYTKKRSTFGFPQGRSIGAKVTLRGKEAEEFLKSAIVAKEGIILEKSFDWTGNVSFGIKEYIDLPKAQYDPSIGVMGFDVSVTLERPGYRVKKRRDKSKVGENHRITKEEAMEFMKEKFGVKFEEE